MLISLSISNFRVFSYPINSTDSTDNMCNGGYEKTHKMYWHSDGLGQPFCPWNTCASAPEPRGAGIIWPQ